VPAPGLESQARPPAPHIHLWLDQVEVFPRGSASSERAASDQGGPGATGSIQGCKEGKYTLDAALDQPCKFHSSLGREVIRPFCITILYHNLLLFIDIFHI
jgi:hypothetical protein